MIFNVLVQSIFRAKIIALVLTASAIVLAQTPKNDNDQDPKKQIDPRVSVADLVGDKSANDQLETASNKFSTVPNKNAAPTDTLSKNIAEKPPLPVPQTSGSGWQFAFTPYLYMTGVEGTIGARGRTAEIDLSFGDVIENLNLGIMGTLEARKGRFVIVNDLMWIKLGEERDTPGDLYSSAKLGVNMFIWDPEAGYRVYEGKAGSFDVLGGVRVMSVETNLNFRAGILPAFDASERKTWATPVVGAHGTLNLSPKFYLSTKFDIGGGIGADFTGQFYGGAGYRITPKIALVGGYRYLNTDYDSEAGFIYNANMNGILFGAKFQF